MDSRIFRSEKRSAALATACCTAQNTTISDLRQLGFLQHHASGVLTVCEGEDPTGIDFPIRRVFAVSGVPAGATRGGHAHRFCTQVVLCLSGRVDIAIDDGRDTTTLVLDSSAQGLYIPPGLWNTLVFEGPGTIISVFCDYPYDVADYIRDRNEYLAIKGMQHA